jgi:hypothetical protein
MPGGKGNIHQSDNPKPFQKGNQAAAKWTEEDALMFVDELIAWMKLEDENIFFMEFILLVCDKSKYKAKITHDTPSYLAKKYTTFSERLCEAKEIEKLKLKKFGAFDKLNSNVVRFLLSAEFGLSEKTKTDLTSDGKPLTPQPVTYNLVKPKDEE